MTAKVTQRTAKNGDDPPKMPVGGTDQGKNTENMPKNTENVPKNDQNTLKIDQNVPKNADDPQKKDGMSDDELTSALKKVLTVPKTKDSLPTLTMYSTGFFKRYMILDVDGGAYAEGWDIYRAERPDGTPQGYILMVTSILSIDLPRMYRDVTFVPLSR